MIALALALPLLLAVPDGDAARLREAYALIDAVGPDVFPGFAEVPAPLLYVGAEEETLFGAPRIPEGFAPAADVPGLPGNPRVRPRTQPPNLLATFPIFGDGPVIVVGSAEATRRPSTAYVLTLLHEHMHQVQMAWPEYWGAVDRLDLSGGDTSGMWMLEYPFPYADRTVRKSFAKVAEDLAAAIEDPSPRRAERFWREHETFLRALAPKDRRYLEFQAWQEGVARYVELRAAEEAARRGRAAPDLPGSESYAAAAARIRRDLLDTLRTGNLLDQRRVAFYAYGAGMALLLDRAEPGWKGRCLGDLRLGPKPPVTR